MKKVFFLIAFSLLNIGLFAQKKSFSSENIDSLLISYKTHQKNELSKAYVVDQIVRYYTNNKNYGEASKYNKEYLKLSIALNSKDLSNRYAFRNACLNYMLSDKKNLDTITCIKAYKYFKRRDHKLYSSISNQMVSYLRGKDGFGSKYMINSEQLIAWYLRSGEDNDRIGEFYYSATDYYNASLNISPKDVKRRESTCRKAIHSSKKSGNKHNIINVTYTLLTETYVENKKTAKTLALEQELIKLKNKNILNNFYGVIGYNNATHLMTKAGILAFKEKQKLVQEQLKQFRDSTLVINLPQGKYYYDVYEQSKINKRYSISIEGSQIHKSTITRSDTLHEILQCA